MIFFLLSLMKFRGGVFVLKIALLCCTYIVWLTSFFSNVSYMNTSHGRYAQVALIDLIDVEEVGSWA